MQDRPLYLLQDALDSIGIPPSCCQDTMFLRGAATGVFMSCCALNTLAACLLPVCAAGRPQGTPGAERMFASGRPQGTPGAERLFASGVLHSPPGVRDAAMLCAATGPSMLQETSRRASVVRMSMMRSSVGPASSLRSQYLQRGQLH